MAWPSDVSRLGETLAETEQRRAALVSDLAHELRTPLTTLRGFLEGLTDGVFEPTPEVLADLTEEVARLQRLVGDLNVLSRADEGALPLELGSPRRRAAGALASLGRLAPQYADKGVSLGLDAPGPATATVDPDRVTQLLTNLVGNALAYTDRGGEVTVAVRGGRERVVVEVTDTGRGIAAEELPRVFDRFHRTDPSGAGTGIGLTIARGIARAHGGDVTASSAGPGRGANFVVTLPVTGPAAGGRTRQRGPDRPGQGPSSAGQLAAPQRKPVPSRGRSACGPEPSWGPLRCPAMPSWSAWVRPYWCWAIWPAWVPSCTCSWRWSPVQVGGVEPLAASAAPAGTSSARVRAPPARALRYLRITHLLGSSPSIRFPG